MSKGRRVPGWAKLLIGLILVAGLILLALRIRYGGGETFPDRIGEAALDSAVFDGAVLEKVVDLPMPPGNIAVSADGRIFFTFHPDAQPTIKVAELVDGQVRAYPDVDFQSEREGLWFDTPLSLRIDRQNHLWVLDHANHGMGDAKLLSFDLATNRVVREVHFSGDEAGLGSHLNDFQVSHDGDHVFIAEASIFAKTPALIHYRRTDGRVRRLLEGHPSVAAEPYYITVDGEPIEPLGLFAVRPGVDSIALDRKGQWLYYAAVTATKMYRLPVAAILDDGLTDAQLADQVEAYADKTLSDGITTDEAGNLYLSDPQHDAIVALRPDKTLEALVVDERLRWPDGFSFGPGGWLYVTCSALQHVILKSREHVQAHAPYQIFRFKTGTKATPGH